MEFEEALERAIELLRREGRISYGGLKRRLGIDDDLLSDLCSEIVHAKQQARDEGGRVLVWTGQADGAQAAAAASPEVESERRQITVMFCDLVGSTQLSSVLDPEDLQELLREVQSLCRTAIARYDGYVAQYLGDGLLVYFGYPQAHEDDALRAVRAGQGILASLQEQGGRLGARFGVRPQVRVGIHTGLVVVGAVGGAERQERLALGQTPNVAARVQSCAAPDQIAVSERTQRLIAPAFECQDLGLHELKGIDRPMRLWHVHRERPAASEPHAESPGRPAIFVGRDAELQALHERWQRAGEGRGQIALVTGEPGIGKSRLVSALARRVAASGAPVVRLQCSPYHVHSALYPVCEALRRAAGFLPADDDDARRSRLEHLLARSIDDPGELAHCAALIGALLGLAPTSGSAREPRLPPEEQKLRTHRALVQLLLARAEEPLLLVCEDLHWADPSTLELLELVIDAAHGNSVLCVLAYRPEFKPPWPRLRDPLVLALARLAGPQVEAMIARLAHGKPLPAEVVRQIAARTDGIPLFIEQLLRMIVDDGWLREEAGGWVLARALSEDAIPETLHDLLTARLDRLGPARELAQLAAAIGREFSDAVLRAAAARSGRELEHELQQLIDSGLVQADGRPPQRSYAFKHALIRDAAYQLLVRERRRDYHGRIARALEADPSGVRETQPELLAHHHAEAGNAIAAIRFWHAASRRAVRASAHQDAVAHLRAALERIAGLPPGPERTQGELDLQLAYGPALMALRGYASADVERAYARARALCRELGETPQLAQVLAGLATYYFTRGDLVTALELGHQYLPLAEQFHEPIRQLQGRLALGSTLYFMGRLAESREHLERGLEIERSAGLAEASAGGAVGDPRVLSRTYLGLALWNLGRPDSGARLACEAVVLARRRAHPISLASSLAGLSLLRLFRREDALARASAEEAIALSREHGFTTWRALGTVVRGAALSLHDALEGVRQIREGIDAWCGAGAGASVPCYLVLLAEAQARAGHCAAAFGSLDEAAKLASTRSDRYHAAEIDRVRGELHAFGPQRDPAQARACFESALQVAREQGALSLELRAACSLLELARSGETDAIARDRLVGVHARFDEGFETGDLRTARALLEFGA